MKRIKFELITKLLSAHKLIRFIFLFGIVLGFSVPASSQVYSPHEEYFAFEVKQIDEFIERFNNEKTLIKEYIYNEYDQLEVSREELLMSLFNQKSAQIEKTDVASFIQLVNDPEKPIRLSFYDDDWYARVKCSVMYEGEERDLFLLMRVQKEENGASKWVVHNVYADFLKTPQENNPHASLNPVSHATDFMALDRAFKDIENLKAYLSSSFQDDQLSKFAIEMQNNRITFKQVEDISYHFFQIDGWILSVENFQRPEKNSGWLIDKLIQADSGEKEKYKQHLLSPTI